MIIRVARQKILVKSENCTNPRIYIDTDFEPGKYTALALNKAESAAEIFQNLNYYFK